MPVHETTGARIDKAAQSLAALVALIESTAAANKANYAVIMLEEPEIVQAQSLLAAISARRGRAPKGRGKRVALEIIASHDGISIDDLGSVSGIPAGTLRRALSELVLDGRATRDGELWKVTR